MSDTQQGHGWWQASDGKWYPPESHPNYVVPPPPPVAPTLPPADPQASPHVATATALTYTPSPATGAGKPKRRWWKWLLLAVLGLIVVASIPAIIDGFKDGFSDGSGEPTSACTDATGGGDGTFDLTAAAVERTGDVYTFTSVFTGPGEGRELSVTWLVNHEGTAYTVSGGSYTDSPADAWVFSMADGQNTYLDEFTVSANSVALTVPADLLGDVAGKAFAWEAVLSIDGADIDNCSAAFVSSS